MNLTVLRKDYKTAHEGFLALVIAFVGVVVKAGVVPAGSQELLGPCFGPLPPPLLGDF